MTRRGRFLLKGALVWLVMPIAAIANGVLRDLLLAPLLGEHAAEILSVLVLLTFIYIITAVFLRRAGLRRRSADLWALGVLWMVLTIAFELVFFGVFLGVPISELLAAYNIFAGELWIVVVVGVLLARTLNRCGPPLGSPARLRITSGPTNPNLCRPPGGRGRRPGQG